MGTRPEVIKLAPVIAECNRRPEEFAVTVCFTGQHQDMLMAVARYFGIRPDIELQTMDPGQSLPTLTARLLNALDNTLARVNPDCIIAQGDTCSVFCAALAAFYRRVPFVHVEAGLRTGDLSAPWPEEMNRRFATLTTRVHCAPTRRAVQNLLNEKIPSTDIYLTGNTVVDALLETVERERANRDHWESRYTQLGSSRVVFITGHRRENHGKGLHDVCTAICRLSRRFPDVEFVYPVHPNPNVSDIVHRQLAGCKSIHLLPPVSYPECVWLMDRATFIMTDSGGIQEEAPSLGKPVLVTRRSTERPEAVESGAAMLVGTDVDVIVAAGSKLLDGNATPFKITVNPYGDGHAAQRIADAIITCLGKTCCTTAGTVAADYDCDKRT
ncbi:MAG TPA: UDP-N-acetylglucosamine 2-epimerase (non-hydrolyzing) [Pirellulales bacterium]|nr:UDP-N-acetylglucosamine 2-epimerase (non-hydrolyzing) [Pirellulales bacterium]